MQYIYMVHKIRVTLDALISDWHTTRGVQFEGATLVCPYHRQRSMLPYLLGKRITQTSNTLHSYNTITTIGRVACYISVACGCVLLKISSCCIQSGICKPL